MSTTRRPYASAEKVKAPEIGDVVRVIRDPGSGPLVKGDVGEVVSADLAAVGSLCKVRAPGGKSGWFAAHELEIIDPEAILAGFLQQALQQAADDGKITGSMQVSAVVGLLKDAVVKASQATRGEIPAVQFEH